MASGKTVEANLLTTRVPNSPQILCSIFEKEGTNGIASPAEEPRPSVRAEIGIRTPVPEWLQAPALRARQIYTSGVIANKAKISTHTFQNLCTGKHMGYMGRETLRRICNTLGLDAQFEEWLKENKL